jgi:hypothetical protein
VEEFFECAKQLDKNLQIFFEFFDPPDRWFFDEAAKIFSNVCYEISPDSHDEKIRKKWEKSITDSDLVLIPGDISWAVKFKDALPDIHFHKVFSLPGEPSQAKSFSEHDGRRLD